MVDVGSELKEVEKLLELEWGMRNLELKELQLELVFVIPTFEWDPNIFPLCFFNFLLLYFLLPRTDETLNKDFFSFLYHFYCKK